MGTYWRGMILLLTYVITQLMVPVQSDFRSNSRIDDPKYFIAAVEIEWDYAPSGTDRVYTNNSNAEFYISRGAGRIGSKYKKAVYREYTDSTFSQQKPHPEWLGIMGPLIQVNMYDTVTVHFKNLASRPYSINVNGGLLKDKESMVYDAKKLEGALYDDGSKVLFKKDDAVPPGGEYTYVWHVSYNEAPKLYEDKCIPWLYQSHVDAVRDVESGLLGVVMVCLKESKLYGRMWEMRKDWDRNYVLLWKIFDENQSWYLDENIEKFSEKSMTKKDDPDFKQSNRMHAVNGYAFGNLPGLEMCKNEFISWSIVGYGSKFNVHSVTFHGHNLVKNDQRANMVEVYPLQSITSRMVALNPGKWLIRCEMHEHYKAGMQAYFTVKECNTPPKEAPLSYARLKDTDKQWTYYIAAEEIEWDYAPSGIDQMTGRRLTEPGTTSEKYFSRTGAGLGGRYKKARYVEYTDASFSVKKSRDASEEHMGLLGPVIKASVGSKIKVVFKNLASRPYSIHPEGVFYDKANEGMLYEDGTSGAEKEDDAVPPGGTYVYQWSVPALYYHLGKMPCLANVYHSGVDPVRDVHSGLVGVLLVCKDDEINATTARQVFRHKEFYLHFSVIDETQSWYIDENIRTYSRNPGAMQINSPGFRESNLKHNINGYMYGNMPVLEMICKAEENAVNLISTGGQNDIFTVHFHGENLPPNKRHSKFNSLYISLQPGQSSSHLIAPYNEGEWIIKPGRFSYSAAGMTAKYRVSSCRTENTRKKALDYFDKFENKTGYNRIYYIAAVETEWNYAPHDYNIVTGQKLSVPDSPGYMYVTRDNNRLGSKYKKAVYQEYEDKTFTTVKQRSAQDEYLGILGPVIKGSAGDTIIVVFKNMASRPYSIHPVGIITNKTDDGYGYSDGTSGETKLDDAVAPGKVHTYTWYLSFWSTPGHEYASIDCFSSVYHSAVNPMKDVHSGLVGPLLICKEKHLDENLKVFWQKRNPDIYFDHYLLFAVFDENLSWYLEENTKKFAHNHEQIDRRDPDFIASNKMHAINGYIFGNMPTIKQTMLSSATFNLMSVGSQEDIHVPHINNNPLKDENLNRVRKDRDGVLLYPGASLAVKRRIMGPLVPGRWLIRCAVNEHYQAGMMALWTITNPFQSMLDLLEEKKNSLQYKWSRLGTWYKVLIFAAIIVGLGIIIGVVRYYYKKRHRQSSSQEADTTATPLNTTQLARA